MKSLNESEMMTDETCIEEIASPPGKRRRVEKRECSKNGFLSIEAMLSVPIDLIFRQLHEKPLLTRAEGQCFLKINFLAQEMEAIVQLAEKMLQQRNRCRGFRCKLDDCPSALLRPVSVIVSIFENQATHALREVQASLSSLMIELSSCSTLLRQSAEQNWSVSESLLDAMGGQSSQVLALAKRNLADLEDEVSKRIDVLISMTMMDYREERRLTDESIESQRARRNLFGKPPTNAPDPWNEPLSDFCVTLFKSLHNKQKTPQVVLAMKTCTQPEQYSCDVASQDEEDTGSMFELKQQYQEVDESQNSFRKKSTAAYALANLALGGGGK